MAGVGVGRVNRKEKKGRAINVFTLISVRCSLFLGREIFPLKIFVGVLC